MPMVANAFTGGEAMKASIEITNIREIEKVLAKIPEEMRKGVMRPTMRKAAGIVSRAAKRRARAVKDTGALAKSIGVISVRKDGMNARVGPRRGYKQPAPAHRKSKKYPNIDPFNYGHLVELGTAAHAQPKRKWAHPGGMAQPYLKPAIEETQEQVIDEINKGLIVNLDKQIAKHAAKNKR